MTSTPSKCFPSTSICASSLWEEDALAGRARFYADSGSSAGKYLNLLDERGWDWTVSYNKWTSVLDTLAAEMDEARWSHPREAVGRSGEEIIEQFGWVVHQPGDECQRPQAFAVVRYRNRQGGELFWPRKAGPVEVSTG